MKHHCHNHLKHAQLRVYLDGENVLTLKNIEKMATIQIDVESNQADLNALVSSANTKIGELQTILGQISSFQLGNDI